ncbi:Inner membrane protein ydgK [Cedecea lapagei]|uniref:Inner membrane protein ydgK n=1 Tax=Cedecea lapagei TaxID=158823 RepID=A0A3S5DPS4_9ENTR|nr:DUF2569 family protein [Cedecea lapagei]VEB98215.1 Inner membrane protein ydgK [Cedecea lapagei]
MTTPQPPRIAGWLLAPLAWLLMSLLSSSVALLSFLMMMLSPEARQALTQADAKTTMLFTLSVCSAMVMWGYTLWLTIAFFKRRKNVVRHYILWLLLTVLLAIKSFAFSPVSDRIAVQLLLPSLLAAALLVPYLKRSKRVKQTFINP